MNETQNCINEHKPSKQAHMFLWILFGIFLLSFWLFGQPKKQTHLDEVMKVSQILVGTPNQYTVLTEPNHNNMVEVKFFWGTTVPVIVKDVPANEQCWVLWTRVGVENRLKEIHIRNINDLQPGHWDNGKQGNGNNIPLIGPEKIEVSAISEEE